MRKFDLKNIDIRKVLGTIIGGIFFICCVLFLTYAYYNWKSPDTNVTLAIQDLSLECLVGADVEVSNIGPVLNYQDGVKTEFSINNSMADNMVIELYLDITTISDNLLTDSFKYVLVADNTGGTNYDYNNPILEGEFTNFTTGNNLITQDLEVTAEITTNYQFIIYIDGNMYNDPNMQENSLVGNLMIGKCSGDSVPYDELVYQAIYSETDNSLTFVHTVPLTVGDTYNDKTITAVYTGFDTITYSSEKNVPWYIDGNYQNITSVNFDSVIKPKSTAYWFYHFKKLVDIDLSKLDTSNVVYMYSMFRRCEKLVFLDLSDFDTGNVKSMNYMFYGCSSLTELDLRSFDTSNVTTMNYMFNECNDLKELDLSNFNTSKVITMESMFSDCSGLINLNLANFNTSNVTNFKYLFNNCSNLENLYLSNFNTSKVENMYGVFLNCSNLKELDVSNFDTSNVKDMSHMFQNCSNLTELDLSNFDTSNVVDMAQLFKGCFNLISLNLGEFDTSNVIETQYMFYECNKLKTSLTVMNFDVTNYQYMFYATATALGAQIIINYIPDDPTTSDTNESTESLVDAMIATKSSNSNIKKGCYGNNCPV